MQSRVTLLAAVFLFASSPLGAQTIQELKAELESLKSAVQRLETRIQELESGDSSGSVPGPNDASPPPREEAPEARRAPALNTPPVLPLASEGYRKAPPRFDVLLQTRADFFPGNSRPSTFFLRKAEIGIKGQVSEHVDFRFELDPVRPADPFRRTYIRLSHLKRLHVKMGMEKAPIGLEELQSTGQIPFVDRSEVNDRFAAAEELGVFLDSRWENWLFQFSVTNGGRRLLRDNNEAKDVAVRAVWGPTPWFSLGAAVLQGKAGEQEQTRDRYNLELKLGSNMTGFQTELYRAQDGALWSSAFYTSAFWAIPFEGAGLTHLQPVIRYEHIGRSDRDPEQELRLLTAGLSFLLDKHRSKFQINYLKDLHTGNRKDEFRAQYQVEF